MSYGLNVEMHKQVSKDEFQIFGSSNFLGSVRVAAGLNELNSAKWKVNTVQHRWNK